MTRRLPKVCFAVLGTASALIAACFSERGGPTQNGSTECRLLLSPGVAGSTVVIIRNFAFEPAQVRVKAGETVTWLNCDDEGQPAHTSTSDQGVWGSASLTTGQVFSREFTQIGQFPYHCEPHPFMTATVIVD